MSSECMNALPPAVGCLAVSGVECSSVSRSHGGSACAPNAVPIALRFFTLSLRLLLRNPTSSSSGRHSVETAPNVFAFLLR